ncbi:uncharacterized protein [Henckelia pumila]|uniref:uncharacterized protein n=1 Tax=Henckelia pumila TaxID=405737 RepID=UPI003C6DC3B6
MDVTATPMETLLKRFQSFKPPNLKGTENSVDCESWLEDIDQFFESLDCTKDRRIRPDNFADALNQAKGAETGLMKQRGARFVSQQLRQFQNQSSQFQNHSSRYEGGSSGSSRRDHFRPKGKQFKNPGSNSSSSSGSKKFGSGQSSDFSVEDSGQVFSIFSIEHAKPNLQEKFRFSKSSRNPDLVLAFLKEHGLSDSQIKHLIKRAPQILTLKPQDNLLPKIEFLRSLGISGDDIIKIIAVAGSFMRRSLENRIIPSFDFMKNMLKSDKDAVDVIKRFPSLLYIDVHKRLRPNVDILLEAGVPEINVRHLFKKRPRTLLMGLAESKEYVERIAEMGFSPGSANFVVGFGVMRRFCRSSWDKKMDVYKRWGYSEDQILLAFRRYPQCIAKSQDKIDAVLDYIINRMGCDPSAFTTFPAMMSLSLKGTIIPRCLVYEVLKSKGLLYSNRSVTGFLRRTKENFLEKFVLPFVDEVPELLQLYPCDSSPRKVRRC